MLSKEYYDSISRNTAKSTENNYAKSKGLTQRKKLEKVSSGKTKTSSGTKLKSRWANYDFSAIDDSTLINDLDSLYSLANDTFNRNDYADSGRRQSLTENTNLMGAYLSELKKRGYDTADAESSAKEYRSAAKEFNAFFKQFKDEKDYNERYAYYQKYDGKSRTDIDKAISDFQSSKKDPDELNWLLNNRYDYYSYADMDAREKELSAKIKASKENDEKNVRESGDVYGTKSDETARLEAELIALQQARRNKKYGEEIAKWDEAHQNQFLEYGRATNELAAVKSRGGLGPMGVGYIDAEKEDGKTIKAFETYLKSIGYDKDEIESIKKYAQSQARLVSRQTDMQAWEKLSDKGFGGKALLSALSLGANVLSGFGAIDSTIQGLTNGKDAITGEETPIDTNRLSISYAAEDMRGAVSKDMGDTGKFLYNVGMSIGDFMLARGAGKAVNSTGKTVAKLGKFGKNMGNLTEVIMAGEATNRAISDAIARGASNFEALGYGYMCGLAEATFERLSIENLNVIEKAVGNATERAGLVGALKLMAIQAGVEGFEEVATTLANTLADAIIMGDKSERNTRIRELVQRGYSLDEAKMQATKEWGTNLAMDFLGGLISGGVTSGVTIASATAKQSIENSKMGEQERANMTAFALIQQAQQFAEGSQTRELADKLARRLPEGANEGVVEGMSKIKNTELGRLARLFAKESSQYGPNAGAQESASANPAEAFRPAGAPANARSTEQTGVAATEEAQPPAEAVAPAETYANAFAEAGFEDAGKRGETMAKLLAGEEVSNKKLSEMASRKDKQAQAVFTQITGVEVPQGLTHAELCAFYRQTAEQLRSKQNTEGTTVEAGGEIPSPVTEETTAGETAAQRASDPTDAFLPESLTRPTAELEPTPEAVAELAGTEEATVEAGKAEAEEPIVTLSDGSTLTRAEFRAQMRETLENKEISDEKLDAMFDHLVKSGRTFDGSVTTDGDGMQHTRFNVEDANELEDEVEVQSRLTIADGVELNQGQQWLATYFTELATRNSRVKGVKITNSPGGSNQRGAMSSAGELELNAKLLDPTYAAKYAEAKGRSNARRAGVEITGVRITSDAAECRPDQSGLITEDGEILIHSDLLSPYYALKTTLGHELLHHGVDNKTSGKSERETDIVDEVISTMESVRGVEELALDARLQVREKQYRDFYAGRVNPLTGETYSEEEIDGIVTEDFLREEVAADLLGEMFYQQNTLNAWARTQPSFISRAYRFMSDMLERATGSDGYTMRKELNGLMTDIKTALTLAGNAAIESGEVEVHHSVVDKEWAEQVDLALAYGYNYADYGFTAEDHKRAQSEIGQSSLYVMKSAPKGVLSQIGLNDLPFCYTASHLQNSLLDITRNTTTGKRIGSTHGLSEDTLKRLPELLEKPIMVIRSNSDPDSVVAFIDAYDSEGSLVGVVIKTNGHAWVDGVFGPANFITSVYGFEQWGSGSKFADPIMQASNKAKSAEWLYANQAAIDKALAKVWRNKKPAALKNATGAANTVSTGRFPVHQMSAVKNNLPHPNGPVKPTAYHNWSKHPGLRGVTPNRVLNKLSPAPAQRRFNVESEFGWELTKGQEKFFKDSVMREGYSKDGRLQHWFHGSPSGLHSVINPASNVNNSSPGGADLMTEGGLIFGYGAFYTSDPRAALSYANKWHKMDYWEFIFDKYPGTKEIWDEHNVYYDEFKRLDGELKKLQAELAPRTSVNSIQDMLDALSYKVKIEDLVAKRAAADQKAYSIMGKLIEKITDKLSPEQRMELHDDDTIFDLIIQGSRERGDIEGGDMYDLDDIVAQLSESIMRTMSPQEMLEMENSTKEEWEAAHPGEEYPLTNVEAIAKDNPTIYEGFLNIANPLHIYCDGRRYKHLGDVSNGRGTVTDEIAGYVYEMEDQYDGVVFHDIVDGGGVIQDVAVAFSANQFKGVDNGEPTKSDDWRFNAEDTEYAPAFYSKMERVIGAQKAEKFAATAVLPMLKGKGVKQEEMKWSGLSTFLDGKKSVTKQELLDFVRSNQVQIDKVELRNMSETGGSRAQPVHLYWNILEHEDPWTAPEVDIVSATTGEVLTTIEYDPFDNTYYDTETDEVYSSPEELLEALLFNPIEGNQEIGETPQTRWGKYTLDGGENYRELLYMMPDSEYHNQSMDVHWGRDGVLAHARVQDFTGAEGGKVLFIEEIQSDWHNAGKKDGYKDESVFEITKKYEELTKKYKEMSEYSRVQFGFTGSVLLRKVEKLEAGDLLNGLPKEKSDEVEEFLNEFIAVRDRYKKVKKQFKEIESRTPDAPYRTTYHEYVLKNLIRDAAEQGYDSIAWTTGRQQEARWSSDFAEGYRIEYDQDIPSFLKKYGKQWGAKVGYSVVGFDFRDTDAYRAGGMEAVMTVALNNADETGALLNGRAHIVHSMNITDAMKRSVLYEGQPRYNVEDDLTSPTKWAYDNGVISKRDTRPDDSRNAGEDERGERGNREETNQRAVDEAANELFTAENAYRYALEGPGVDELLRRFGERKVSKVRTNTFTRSGIFKAAELELPGLTEADHEYNPTSNKASMEEAERRLRADYDGEKAALQQRTGAVWTDVEVDMSMGILSQELEYARENNDYSEVVRWAQRIRRKGTQAGQLIQAFAKYNRTPEGVLIRAANDLQQTSLNKQQREELLRRIGKFSETLETIREGDKEALIQLIVRQAEQRNTPVSNATMKAMRRDSTSWQFLYDTALTQLDNIAKDYIKTSFGKKVATYQTISHLLNLKTALRNLGSNNVFTWVETVANDMAMVPDLICSVVTGERTVGLDRGRFSKAAREGAKAGRARSQIEVALDVQPDDARDKYGTSRRTWKMTGGKGAQVMSTLEKAMGFELNYTDESAKGAIRAQIRQSLQPMVDKGTMTAEEAEDFAEQEALYRTFQDDTWLSNLLSKDVKPLLNSLIGIGDSGVRTRGGRVIHDFGLGDFVVKYTQVPGALITRAVEFSPVGYAKMVKNMWAMAEAKRALNNTELGAKQKALAEQELARAQRETALACGRATTGLGLIKLFATLATAGLLHRSDDEDDPNAKALNTAMGFSGTQLNISALTRGIDGGDMSMREGDVLVSLDFLEPLNSLMAMGTLVAKEGEDASVGDKLSATLAAIWNSTSELSVMQTLRTINQTSTYYTPESGVRAMLGSDVNNENFSSSERTVDMISTIAFEVATSSLSGFVPAPVRQAAQALDDRYRDTYSEKGLWGRTMDKMQNTIPVAREDLPEKLDNFGETRMQEDPLMRAANAFLMPGSITTYKSNAAADELAEVYKATGKTTIFPDRSAPYKVEVSSDDEDFKFKLTAGERAQFLRTRGQETERLIQEAIDSEAYRSADSATRAEMLGSIKNFANYLAKVEYCKGKGVEYSNPEYDNIAEALSNGMKLPDYISYKGAANKLSADKDEDGKTISGSKKAKVVDLIDSLDVSAETKDYLYLKNGYSEKDINETPWH